MDTGFLFYLEILGILLILSLWFLISKMGITVLSHRLVMGLSASLWISLSLSHSLWRPLINHQIFKKWLGEYGKGDKYLESWSTILLDR